MRRHGACTVTPAVCDVTAAHGPGPGAKSPDSGTLDMSCTGTAGSAYAGFKTDRGVVFRLHP